MQEELEAEFPGQVYIAAINAVGEEHPISIGQTNDVADLPFLQDVAAQDVWGSWGAKWRDIILVEEANRKVSVLNLTANDLYVPANYAALKKRFTDELTDDDDAE